MAVVAHNQFQTLNKVDQNWFYFKYPRWKSTKYKNNMEWIFKTEILSILKMYLSLFTIKIDELGNNMDCKQMLWRKLVMNCFNTSILFKCYEHLFYLWRILQYGLEINL